MIDRNQTKSDESKYAWLKPLLDTYELFEKEYPQYIKQENTKRQKQIACSKGCSVCCKNPKVPILPFEIMGLSWYLTELMEETKKEIILEQIKNHKSTLQCPFLLNEECSIYPVRPIACRIFYIYGTQCLLNEDIIETRFNDILMPSREIGLKSAYILLPLFGIKDKKEQELAFFSGFIENQTVMMHDLNWDNFYFGLTNFKNKI